MAIARRSTDALRELRMLGLPWSKSLVRCPLMATAGNIEPLDGRCETASDLRRHTSRFKRSW